MNAKTRIGHRQIVEKLLESKAVDFAAIGKTVAEVGPLIALADEPWEGFCGTNRRFVVLYRLADPDVEMDGLQELSAASGDID